MFDRFVMVDWSARSRPSGARPEADAIWIGVADASGAASEPYYVRTRAAAMDMISGDLARWLAEGRRVLLGFDFPFGYPEGFAAAVTGTATARAVWADLAERIADAPNNANNRFEVAAALNRLLPGRGPFWGRPAGLDLPDLPARGSERGGHGLPERRRAEAAVKAAQPCWKLFTTGAVGSQMLLGLPRLAALGARFAGKVAVWPFEAPTAPIVLAEIYPSLLADEVRAVEMRKSGRVRDAVQVDLVARTLAAAQQHGTLSTMLAAVPEGPARREEGWILGVGAEAPLHAAARTVLHPELDPPKLRNDCFALPQGVEWTPVDTALARLRAGLSPVTRTETLPADRAAGRILAAPVRARRANPPAANSAVDGYGLAAGSVGPGKQVLPLAPGRAAAGAPFAGEVGAGRAVRILTGALLPRGVDSVVLEEDTATDGRVVSFMGPVRPGSNARAAGEDVAAGTEILAAGRRLGAPDLALLAATGVSEVAVRAQLRVAVLSTGDEITPAGTTHDPARTYDANRPMLLALAARWGHLPVDLGHVGDDRSALRARFEAAAARSDALLVSGGASAGDEDHVSALLRAEATLQHWRIALKPGRPLALAVWDGLPVFGLPGNPVAAFVCSLVFAYPALARLAGADWPEPRGFTVPAAFGKRKKAGRREFLRARLDAAGHAEVFASEGSGRISGLSWADGLVELPDAAVEIQPSDPVRYLPYSSFGL